MIQRVNHAGPDASLTAGLSSWQRAVNQAGYASYKSDVRAVEGSVARYANSASATILRSITPVKVKFTDGMAGTVTAPMLSRERTLDQLRRDFEQHFAGQLDIMADEILGPHRSAGDGVRTTFMANARHGLEAIAQALSSKDLPADAGVRDAVLTAHAEAEKLLIDLRSDYLGEVDKTPQFFFHQGKVTILRTAPPPENLILRGGGTKGVAYANQIKALEEQGILRGLRRIAGTSAGALTASLLAGGLNAESFARVSRERSPWEMATKVDTKVLEAVQFKGLGFKASAVVSLIDDAIRKSISTHLREQQPDLSALTPQERDSLQLLVDAPPGTPVTFGQLRLMSRLAPEQFKELTLAVFDATEQGARHISADTHPDWGIGQTARMSMAIPLMFAGVMGPDGHRYQDGGLRSNLPSEVFVDVGLQGVPDALLKATQKGSPSPESVQTHLMGLKPLPPGAKEGSEQPDRSQGRTLMISFDEAGNFHKVVNMGRLMDPAAAVHRAFGAKSEATAADRVKLYAAGPNAMAAYHGTLSTQSFLASPRELQLAEMFSLAKSREQLRQLRPTDLAMHEVHASLGSAVQSLTTDELQLALLACRSRLNEAAGSSAPLPDAARVREADDRELLKALEDEWAARTPAPPRPADASQPMSDRAVMPSAARYASMLPAAPAAPSSLADLLKVQGQAGASTRLHFSNSRSVDMTGQGSGTLTLRKPSKLETFGRRLLNAFTLGRYTSNVQNPRDWKAFQAAVTLRVMSKAARGGERQDTLQAIKAEFGRYSPNRRLTQSKATEILRRLDERLQQGLPLTVFRRR